MVDHFPDKDTEYCRQAIEYLTQSVNLVASTQRGSTLRTLHFLAYLSFNIIRQKPLKQLTKNETINIKQAEEIFDALIIQLENAQHYKNFFLLSSYHHIGLIQETIYENFEKAQQFYSKGIEQKHIPSCMSLSKLHMHKQNYAEALELAKKGLSYAQKQKDAEATASTQELINQIKEIQNQSKQLACQLT
ncbi:MAG: hypothetical protein WD055_05640 [Candidatus Dependentiae bacterium]